MKIRVSYTWVFDVLLLIYTLLAALAIHGVLRLWLQLARRVAGSDGV